MSRGGYEARYQHLADEDLMAAVEGGDADAFAALYGRHGRAAYYFSYKVMGDRQAAEDLAQDAFLKVWRSAGGYRPERGSVRTWILSIVHNRGIDLLRSSASRRRTRDEAKRPRGPNPARTSPKPGATTEGGGCSKPSGISRMLSARSSRWSTSPA